MSLEEAIAEAVGRAVRKALQDIRTPQAESDELLTLREAADVAHVSLSTVRQWLARGLLTRRGEGRAIRVLRSEVLSVKPAPTGESPKLVAARLLSEDDE